ncbi:hypothetical protein [Acinetobacter sp. BSP-28]|uniref:hypothetical protein n=1 Tax=Acinetobacter sp. BSP-28 TaxID=3344661 RepID=UPI00376FA836
MINPENYNLIICVNEQIDEDITKKIEKSIESVPNTLIVPIPPAGPQASILLAGITYIAVKICDGFFTKIGEMIAEKAFSDLMRSIKEGQQEPYIITAGGIMKGTTNGYSLHHSIIYALSNGSTLKFIFKADWDMSQFNKAVIIYNREMRKYVKNQNNQISNIIETKLPFSGFHIITADLDSDSIIHVDIFKQ